MQEIVVSELKNDSLPINDALFSKGVQLLAAQMTRINERLEALNINAFAASLAAGFLERLNRNNRRSMDGNIKRATGIDITGPANTPDIRELLDVKIAENVALINSIKTEYINDIGKIVRDNVINGERSTRLITEIKERGKVTESRAKLIARTETAKVNSQLTQLRAEALGASTYTWSGSLDERERKSHLVMEGLLCRFDDKTVYSDDDGKTWKKRKAIGGVELHPGEDYQCRCDQIIRVNFG